jgi:hypothetical protein
MYSLLCKGTSYFISLRSTGERYHETSTTRSISRQLGQSQVRIVQKQQLFSHDKPENGRVGVMRKMRKKFLRDLLVVVESHENRFMTIAKHESLENMIPKLLIICSLIGILCPGP